MDRTLEELILDRISQERDKCVELIESIAEDYEHNLQTYGVLYEVIDQIRELADEE